MALINLQTNLRNLKYGDDRIYGGNSGQPYITSPIPDGTSNVGIANNDFILRGGIDATVDSAIDVLRLGKMFTDLKTPNGLFFTAKQNLLSRTAVRTQTSGILNEGIYTPLSTLAEAGLVAFGGHLLKQGINPFAGTGAYSNNPNLYGVKVTNNQSQTTNRLVNLYGAKLLTPYTGIPSLQFLKDGISPFPNNLITYSGGPGSILGVGSTNIRLASNNLINSNPLSDIANPAVNYLTLSYRGINATSATVATAANNNSVISTQQYEINNPRNSKNYTPTSIDFRQSLRQAIKDKGGNSTTLMSNAPSYDVARNKTIEGRTNYGDPGNRTGKNLISYTSGSRIGPVDKINALALYQSEAVDIKKPINDLVKFRIASINNSNPSQKVFMHFRALLNSMSDSYNGTWNSATYLGRGENFYTYNNYTRTISLSWTVAAQSKEELIPMYKKLNYLASNIAPDYTSKGYMAGNLVQLTIGGYLYEQVGIITGLTYDIQEDTPWEVAINDSGDNDPSVKELPHIIRVSNFTFIPIQSFLPSKQSISSNTQASALDGNTYGPQRFIALANGKGTDTNNYDS
jgi:hypothetical protein